MSKQPRQVPQFHSEAEKRKFWETHDSTNYVGWSKAERARFPNLKPPAAITSGSTSVRKK